MEHLFVKNFQNNNITEYTIDRSCYSCTEHPSEGCLLRASTVLPAHLCLCALARLGVQDAHCLTAGSREGTDEQRRCRWPAANSHQLSPSRVKAAPGLRRSVMRDRHWRGVRGE